MKTLEGLNSVRKISTSLKSLYEVARHANSDPAKQKKIKKQIDTIRDQVVEKMESVNLHGVLKDRMVQRVRESGDSDPDGGARDRQLPASAWDQR